MTESDQQAAALTLTAESMRLAKIVESLLPHFLPPTHWEETQKGLRYSSDDRTDPLLFCWLKLAGAVATVVPMCGLMSAGFSFAAVILARSVGEAVLSIRFMFPDPKNPSVGPTEKQQKALTEFYTEIWEDNSKPFESTKKISHIPLDDLCSAWGKLVSAQPGQNPHDMTQTVRQSMSCYSNYTHMGYSALMELFKEPPLSLTGAESANIHFRLYDAAICLNSVCQVTSYMLAVYSMGLNPEEPEKRLLALCERYQCEVDAISQRLTIGFGLTCDSKKLLRALKTGKPIDEILNQQESPL